MDIRSIMNNLIRDFISLKIDHIRSSPVVFCKYFFIVAYYSMYMCPENQYNENR